MNATNTNKIKALSLDIKNKERIANNITPVIESDFSSSEKLNSVYSFLENER